MPHSTDLTGKIRVIGLVASFVALAAIGLTVVADRGLSGASRIGYAAREDFPASGCWPPGASPTWLSFARTARRLGAPNRTSRTKPDVEDSCLRR